MKKTKLICIFLIILLLLVTGCENNNITKIDGGDVVENDVTSATHINTLSTDYGLVFKNEIIIYEIKREVFQSFLNNPLHSTLEKHHISKNIYSKNGEYHPTSNVTLFPIKTELIDFCGDEAKIKKFLANNGINEKIKSMAIIDSPNIPITLWVKTTKVNIYITINYCFDTSAYTYDFFDESLFVKKYIARTGKLLVNKKEVSTDNQPMIYYENADIPLLATLEFLGADVTWQDSKNAIIYYHNEEYQLNLNDCSLCRFMQKKDNMLYQVDGGPTFIYALNKELMVDKSSFSLLLYNMGDKITVSIDNEENVVMIDASLK